MEFYRAERENADGSLADLDVYQLARLAKTVKATVLVGMYEQGRLVASTSGTVTVVDPEPRDRVEAALIEAAGPTRTVRITKLFEADLGRDAERDAELARRGLLEDRELYDRVVTPRVRRPAGGGPGAPGGGGVGVVVGRPGQGCPSAAAFFVAILSVAMRSVFRWPPLRRFPTDLADRLLAAARADVGKAVGAGDAGDPPLVRAVALHGLSALPKDHDLVVATATAEAEDRRTFDELMRRHREAAEGQARKY
ncbi:TIGR04222 domain-containing membrane protein [Kitasatospora gansuensis]